MRHGLTNGPLTPPAGWAVGGNGVYNYGNVVLSSSYEKSNCYVGVAFKPVAGSSSYLVLSFNPPDPNITSSAPLGSVVATITASWSDDSQLPERYLSGRLIPTIKEFSRSPGTI